MNKRRAKDKVARLEKDIDKLSSERQLRRQRRNIRSVPIISIVGYTNAGKSTLLNALTGAEVYAKDELFATLDPTSRRLRFPQEREVVLTDTVGFIRDLPESLVNAFRATLEELHDANLLLHVVDASDPRHEAHLVAVEKVLDDLGIHDTPRIVVFNKVDALEIGDGRGLAERHGGMAVSALNKKGFEPLLNRCAEILWQKDALPNRQKWAPVPDVDSPPHALEADGDDEPKPDGEFYFDGRVKEGL
jgi:GTP-binding protein HflX